ncbi:pyridoxamine 5'-phosphate oxidase [Nocardioides albertanoniae]|uniref:Pyridoxamine 5'-phosphate oxidase n=1 Tax=Nocardioides albertanoniae TaxID=1175486 RepID=A0A543A5C2_9ACTN|nr:pyridoxamine 5'-phosphate oxidase family protein [Nocardioides albertanoniae]TQL67737.1 pyridoxamine 5'-phosphate oxidase [Nocardioides albertanoniae]
MKTYNLAEMYGAPTMSWEEVSERLEAGFNQGPGSQEGEPGRYTTWVSTINADGGPHVNAVGAVWFEGSFYLVTGPTTRRGRNLDRDPRCAVSLSVREFDLVVEGRATRVLGDELARVARRYHDDEGWPAEVDESGDALTAPFSAQSAGPAPWHVHRLEATSAHAVQCVEPYAATRWRF